MESDRDVYFRNIGYEQGFKSGYRVGGASMFASGILMSAVGAMLMIHKWGWPWLCS